MESVTGYGLGAVITAPLLIRHSLPPAKAIIVGVLGLVLVPWGSLGPGTLVAATLCGEDLTGLGMWPAVLMAPVLVVSMIGVFAVAIGPPQLSQVLIAILVIIIQWFSLILANVFLGIALAGVTAAAVTILALLALTRLRSGPVPKVGGTLYPAILPYIVLVGGIFVATMVITLFISAVCGVGLPVLLSGRL